VRGKAFHRKGEGKKRKTYWGGGGVRGIGTRSSRTKKPHGQKEKNSTAERKERSSGSAKNSSGKKEGGVWGRDERREMDRDSYAGRPDAGSETGEEGKKGGPPQTETIKREA